MALQADTQDIFQGNLCGQTTGGSDAFSLPSPLASSHKLGEVGYTKQMGVGFLAGPAVGEVES